MVSVIKRPFLKTLSPHLFELSDTTVLTSSESVIDQSARTFADDMNIEGNGKNYLNVSQGISSVNASSFMMTGMCHYHFLS